MEKDLELFLAITPTERFQPLLNGEVKPDGITIKKSNLDAFEIFWNMLGGSRDFDICEMSMSYYLIAKERGHDIMAIPVFPSRMFRHNSIYINADSGIKSPQELKGKKVGLPEYQMTSTLEARGVLQHEYGIYPEDIEWYRGGETAQHDLGEKLELKLHKSVNIQDIDKHKTLDRMLEAGELDALISPRPPEAIRNGNPKVKRLFENYKEVEKNYFKKTGIFPIMHTFVIRNKILEENPWVAQSLYEALVRSKEYAFSRFFEYAPSMSAYPWFVQGIEETIEVMGRDFWPYGLEKNRTSIEKSITYSFEQGLISRKLSIEELFIPVKE